MSDVTSEFRRRWRSGRHVGTWRPRCKVIVRKGVFLRNYFHWTGERVGADVWGETSVKPWRGKWTPSGDWIEVPGVTSVNLNQGFDTDGTATGTVVLDNVLYTEKTGTMDLLYHEIRRGALSPYYGYEPPEAGFDPPEKNEWYGILTEDTQIKIFMGYGLDEMPAVFTGFIDKVTPRTHPSQITLTIRDSQGKLLTDQHVFGSVKPRQLPLPIKFRQEKRKGKKVAFGAKASSHYPGHPGRFVLDADPKTAWISNTRHDPDNTEWVQVKLRKGTYSHFFINSAYPGLEMYVGIYAKNRKGEQKGSAVKPAQVNGANVAEGWIDMGLGTVPGDVDGGWEYMHKYPSIGEGPALHKLPAVVNVGDGTILRVGFRKLLRNKHGNYHASVRRLAGVKDPPDVGKEKGKEKVILVDDPSDIVRTVLRWAGFTDWHIKDTGVELKGDWVFARDATLMDVIQKVKELTGYIFFSADPEDGSGLGTPVFRQSKVLESRPEGRRSIRDTDLLVDLEVNLTDEPKSYNLRVRGRAEGGGYITAFYEPPWNLSHRMSKIFRRAFAYDNPKIKDQATAEVMARLTALEMALAGATCRAVIPGSPEFDLDDRVALIDTQTGTQSRMLVSSRSHEFKAGRDAAWVTTLEGALIDHIDVVEVKADLREYLTSDGSLSEIMEAFQ